MSKSDNLNCELVQRLKYEWNEREKFLKILETYKTYLSGQAGTGAHNDEILAINQLINKLALKNLENMWIREFLHEKVINISSS